jgi:hypothetical protein
MMNDVSSKFSTFIPEQATTIALKVHLLTFSAKPENLILLQKQIWHMLLH